MVPFNKFRVDSPIVFVRSQIGHGTQYIHDDHDSCRYWYRRHSSDSVDHWQICGWDLYCVRIIGNCWFESYIAYHKFLSVT